MSSIEIGRGVIMVYLLQVIYIPYWLVVKPCSLPEICFLQLFGMLQDQISVAALQSASPGERYFQISRDKTPPFAVPPCPYVGH
jgi:hypothetical protein